jgi:hypothetical protein
MPLNQAKQPQVLFIGERLPGQLRVQVILPAVTALGLASLELPESAYLAGN